MLGLVAAKACAEGQLFLQAAQSSEKGADAHVCQTKLLALHPSTQEKLQVHILVEILVHLLAEALVDLRLQPHGRQLMHVLVEMLSSECLKLKQIWLIMKLLLNKVESFADCIWQVFPCIFRT